MTKPLTPKAAAVLSYLQQHDGEDPIGKEIASALGLPIRVVTATVTGLSNKKLVYRAEVAAGEPKAIRLTDAGRQTDTTVVQ